MAGEALHCGFELTLKECDNNGLVELLVFLPSVLCRFKVIEVIVVLFLMPLPIVSLGTRTLISLST